MPDQNAPLTRAAVCFHVWVSILICSALFLGPRNALGANVDSQNEFDVVAYWAMDDLANAAAKMRSDALNLGVDISIVPEWRNFRVFSDTSSGTISVPATRFVSTTIDLRDKLLAQRCVAAKANGIDSAELVVIMVTKRNLSINEIASVLEGRVRILNSYASNVFVVRGKEADLGALVQRDYFGWISEVTPDVKRGIHWQESPVGEYEVFSFGPVTAEYVQELESLGLIVTETVTLTNALITRGAWDQVRNLPALWWVQFVLVNIPDAAEDAPLTESRSSWSAPSVQNAAGAMSLPRYFSANDSRTLVAYPGADDSGDGVVIGIRDWAISLRHPSIASERTDGSELTSAGSTPSGKEYHGLKVASVALGGAQACGSATVQGVAPQARLLFRPATETLSRTFSLFGSGNAKITSQSLHYLPLSSGCDEKASFIDQIAYEDGPLVITVIGNRSNVGDYMVTPAICKNALTVGGIQYANSYVSDGVHVAGQIPVGALAGPTPDGRLKPELVAPSGMIDGDYDGGIISATLEQLENGPAFGAGTAGANAG